MALVPHEAPRHADAAGAKMLSERRRRRPADASGMRMLLEHRWRRHADAAGPRAVFPPETARRPKPTACGRSRFERVYEGELGIKTTSISRRYPQKRPTKEASPVNREDIAGFGPAFRATETH